MKSQLGCPHLSHAAAFCSLQGQILLAPEEEKPTDGQTELWDETFETSDLWRGGNGGKASTDKGS